MKSLEYQLGYYVGEYIYHTQLPTLSTDLLHSRKVIQVTISEADQYHALEEKWRKSKSDLDWNTMKDFRHALAKKYLPNKLECFIPKLDFNEQFDITEFKKGLRWSLWDCDLCWYKIEKDEDIGIQQESLGGYFTQINLILDVTLDDV